MINRRKTRALALMLPAVMIAALPLVSQASPRCTTAPKSTWLSEAQMKEKIARLGYHDIRVFQTTKSGCYEIYGRNAKGARAEVYFNPVDGSIVQANEG